MQLNKFEYSPHNILGYVDVSTQITVHSFTFFNNSKAALELYNITCYFHSAQCVSGLGTMTGCCEEAFGFNKRLVIFWPSERLSGSETEVCSTELPSCHC
jgi:hypothetical protein